MSWQLPILIASAAAVAVVIAAVLLRRAGAPIPAVLAAGLAALGTGAICWRWQTGAWPPWWLPVPCLLTVFAVPLALADLRHRRLPDVLTLSAYPALATALAVAALTGGGPAPPVRALAGALVFGGAHALVHARAPASLGAGDVKLAGSLGGVLAAIGWATIPVAAFAAALLSGLWAACARRRRVPHGPSLLLATWLCAVFPGTTLAPG